jgi:cyanophycinase
MLKFSLLAIALLTSSAHAETTGTKLLLCGGGDRPTAELKVFTQWAGGADSHILVITWATHADPKIDYTPLAADLAHAGAAVVEGAFLAPATAADKVTFLAQLKNATGVFFSGGDQTNITAVLKDSEIKSALIAQYEAGIPFAGTSAGTAVMSNVMITGTTTPLSQGLGLLNNVIMDTHFLKRARIPRLTAFVSENPTLLGVDVDQGTAVAVTDGENAKVVGPYRTVLINGKHDSEHPSVTDVQPGQCFHLSTGRIVECQDNEE